MRYALDIAMEVDGVLVRQHITNLTEDGMHQHINGLLMEPVEIIECIVSESEPFDDGHMTA